MAGATVERDLVAAVAEARADGYGVPVRALPLEEPGWRPSGTVPADLDAKLDAVAEATGTRSRAATATFLLEPHAWMIATACASGLLAHGAMPRLAAARVHDAPHGWIDAIALPRDGWEPASGAALAARLCAHFEPLVDALVNRRPRPALWRSVGDRLGQGTVWAGAAFGAPDSAWALLEEALAAPTPLAAPCELAVVDGRGFRRRSGCCLSHRSPGGPICPDCVIDR